MVERDFKTAAANLLAQHPSVEAGKAAGGPSALPEQQAKAHWQQGANAEPTAKSTATSSRQTAVIAGFIAVTTAVMLLLMPETTLGIGGNIVLGVVGGGWFGYLINREFLQ